MPTRARDKAGGGDPASGALTDNAIDPSIRLKRVDAASARWDCDRIVALRDEQRASNQSAQTPEQEAAQYKSLRGRARALAAEFENIKAQNRRAHGVSDDGTQLLQATESAAPESAAPTSGELAAIQ